MGISLIFSNCIPVGCASREIVLWCNEKPSPRGGADVERSVRRAGRRGRRPLPMNGLRIAYCKPCAFTIVNRVLSAHPAYGQRCGGDGGGSKPPPYGCGVANSNTKRGLRPFLRYIIPYKIMQIRPLLPSLMIFSKVSPILVREASGICASFACKPSLTSS